MGALLVTSVKLREGFVALFVNSELLSPHS